MRNLERIAGCARRTPKKYQECDEQAIHPQKAICLGVQNVENTVKPSDRLFVGLVVILLQFLNLLNRIVSTLCSEEWEGSAHCLAPALADNQMSVMQVYTRVAGSATLLRVESTRR